MFNFRVFKFFTFVKIFQQLWISYLLQQLTESNTSILQKVHKYKVISSSLMARNHLSVHLYRTTWDLSKFCIKDLGSLLGHWSGQVCKDSLERKGCQQEEEKALMQRHSKRKSNSSHARLPVPLWSSVGKSLTLSFFSSLSLYNLSLFSSLSLSLC